MNQWIPLESPDSALPACLATCGVPIKPLVHAYPGNPTQAASLSLSWQAGTHSLTDPALPVAELIQAWKAGTLSALFPASPFLAARAAILTRIALADWLSGRTEQPCTVLIPGTRTARLMAPSAAAQRADLRHHCRPDQQENGTGLFTGKSVPTITGFLLPLDPAAAAITCGLPLLTASPCGKLLQIAAACVLPPASHPLTGAPVPNLTGPDILRATQHLAQFPEDLSTYPLPGSAPGEHPFLYALAAIQQARHLKKAAESADPILYLTARSSGHSALISQSLESSGAAFMAHAHHHLR
jgi:hypothetical protein